MSEQLIATLQKQVEFLQEENLRFKAEAKDRRLQAKELRTQNEKLAEGYQALEAQIAELQQTSQAEVAELRQRSEAEPHELQAEVDRLKGELRTRDHKQAFHKAAKGANVREDAVDDLWKVSGYEPEGDPDDSKITEAIGQAVKVRPWLVQQQQSAAERPNGDGRPSTATPLTTGARPGPGAGRGVPDTERPQTLNSRIDADFAQTKRSNPGRIA